MNSLEQILILENKFGTNNIEFELEQAEKELNNPKTQYLTHEEVIENLKNIL